jgi:hypothetical protein
MADDQRVIVVEDQYSRGIYNIMMGAMAGFFIISTWGLALILLIPYWSREGGHLDSGKSRTTKKRAHGNNYTERDKLPEPPKQSVAEYYEGETSRNNRTPHGRGTKRFRDGSSYDGEWKNGKFHGHGLFVSEEKTYEGDFKNGNWHGKGRAKWVGVGAYEGDFENGEQHGWGVSSWLTGDRCEGEHKNGQVSGKGTYYHADGGRYEGDFLPPNARREGQGTLYYADGGRYEGGWKDDKEHGQGVLVESVDGSRYEGGFWLGQTHGQGTKHYADGRRVTFEAKFGRWGEAVWIYPNGDRYEGRYEEGVWQGPELPHEQE